MEGNDPIAAIRQDTEDRKGFCRILLGLCLRRHCRPESGPRVEARRPLANGDLQEISSWPDWTIFVVPQCSRPLNYLKSRTGLTPRPSSRQRVVAVHIHGDRVRISLDRRLVPSRLTIVACPWSFDSAFWPTKWRPSPRLGWVDICLALLGHSIGVTERGLPICSDIRLPRPCSD
jgi:hypothetical protein